MSFLYFHFQQWIVEAYIKCALYFVDVCREGSGLDVLGHAHLGGHRSAGRPQCAHHDLLAHVLRRSQEWSHANPPESPQHQVFEPTAISCIPGKFTSSFIQFGIQD